MSEELNTSGLDYNEAIEVKGIFISVYFNILDQKFEIELIRKNGDEGEQPLTIVISNDGEEGKNPKLAQEFFKLACNLARQGKEIQEIFEALEQKRESEKVQEAVESGGVAVQGIIAGPSKEEKKSSWLETRFLGNNPSNKEILDYLYKLIYGVETDKVYEGGEITKEENLVINFVKRYPQANGEILRLVYNIGLDGHIKDNTGLKELLGNKKASFFLFMLHFTDLKASIIDDIDEDLNLKDILEKYFTNNTLISNSDNEYISDSLSYQWKLPILRYYGIGDENIKEIGIFNKIIEAKYNEFIKRVLILDVPKEERAKLVLEKLGKQDIPSNSPIFGAMVQILKGKNFEEISMGGFEELEDGVLKSNMEKAGIPTTREGLEEILVGK